MREQETNNMNIDNLDNININNIDKEHIKEVLDNVENMLSELVNSIDVLNTGNETFRVVESICGLKSDIYKIRNLCADKNENSTR